MEPVRVVEGTAVPLDRSDVDTDQIIPAQYLKRIERTGFGPFLFDEWRKDPGFVLNDPRYAGASILLAGAELRLVARAASTRRGRSRTTGSARSSLPASPTSSATTAARSGCCRWSCRTSPSAP